MKIKKITSEIYTAENVFPEKILTKIYSQFNNIESKSWKLISQKKPLIYNELFKSTSMLLPNKKEIYFAKFYRNDKLRNNFYVKSLVKKFVFPYIEKKFKIKINKYDIRCHKYKKDNFLRLHFDDILGVCAITINLNKSWKWDWGGILSVAYGKHYEKLYSFFPGWNSMSVFYPGKRKVPHFVSCVQSYAMNPRYSISIFIN